MEGRTPRLSGLDTYQCQNVWLDSSRHAVLEIHKCDYGRLSSIHYISGILRQQDEEDNGRVQRKIAAWISDRNIAWAYSSGGFSCAGVDSHSQFRQVSGRGERKAELIIN